MSQKRIQNGDRITRRKKINENSIASLVHKKRERKIFVMQQTWNEKQKKRSEMSIYTMSFTTVACIQYPHTEDGKRSKIISILCIETLESLFLFVPFYSFILIWRFFLCILFFPHLPFLNAWMAPFTNKLLVYYEIFIFSVETNVARTCVMCLVKMIVWISITVTNWFKIWFVSTP